MVMTTRTVSFVSLGATAAIAATFAIMKPVKPGAPRQDRNAERVWSGQLDRTLGPVMADCVRFEVAGHVAPVDLDAMLVRAGGDARLPPFLRLTTERALERCRRHHPAE